MNLRFLTLVVGLVAGLVSHTTSAQVVAPVRGGEVGLIRVTATTMELSFGTRGTGQGRVVAIAPTGGEASAPLTATDNLFYVANAVYGQGAKLDSGYAVYNGTGHSITVTGLQPNTYYYVTNAEYNADSSSIAYNTRGSSFSTATRAAPPAPLPVELITFTGIIDAHSYATLNWTTANERNTDYFAVERSTDSIAFAETDRVAAAGSSTRALAYHWPDPQGLTVSTYYRLRQADRNGAVHYSSVVALTPPPRVARQVEVYPNPSAGHPVQLLLQGFAGESLSMRLSDALGRPVLAQALIPAESYYLSPLPLPRGLPTGTYFLSLAGSGSTIQKRIVISD